jgi:hypothetical protein
MAGREDEAATDDEEGEWRFSLSDLEDEETQETDEPTDDEQAGSVAGSFSPSDTIEPGTIDLENAVFVLLGVALGVGAIGAYAAALL